MGLRIIDRQYRVRADVSDGERRASLEQSTRRWLATKGADNALSETEFLSKFDAIRRQVQSADAMIAMAARIREGISRQDGSAVFHQQVDIATLLQLL